MAKVHNQNQIRIGVDGNEANVAQRVGSNVYAFELLRALYFWLEKTRQFEVVVYINGPRVGDWPAETAWWQYRELPRARMSTLWHLPWYLRGNPDGIQLWYSPGHYVPSWSPVPVVPTIMDLAYEFSPDQFTWKDRLQLQLMTRASVARAKHVCVISQATERDVVKHYGRSRHDITVIYPAVEPPQAVSDQDVALTLTHFGVTEPYILYVGTLQPRKNLVRLIQAFELLAQEHLDWQLVLAGKQGWKSEAILEAYEHSSVKDRVHMLGYVDESQKNALIQGAATLALVGLYEGFGLPPLQAIQMGTVPVVANNSSLPEVVGPAGQLVDATDVRDIARGLATVVEAPASERKQWLREQQRHVQQFSWTHSAEQLGELLWRLATDTHTL